MNHFPQPSQRIAWPLWLWQWRGPLLLLAAGTALLLALLWSAAQPPLYQAVSAYRWRYIPATAAMGNVFFPGSDPDTSPGRIRDAQADYCAFVLGLAAHSEARPEAAAYGTDCLFVGKEQMLLLTWGPDADETARYNSQTGAQAVQRTSTALSSSYALAPAAAGWITALPRPLDNALLLGGGSLILAASLLLGVRLLAWPAVQRF